MHLKFPTLESKRTILRQINNTDLENVYKGLSNPNITKYYGVSFESLEATKEQMIWFSELEKTGKGIWWAICNKENGEFLGAGGLNKISMQHKKSEIGFWLLPEFWGYGYMTETMPIILKYAFEDKGLHRIEGYVEPKNKNCKRALL